MPTTVRRTFVESSAFVISKESLQRLRVFLVEAALVGLWKVRALFVSPRTVIAGLFGAKRIEEQKPRRYDWRGRRVSRRIDDRSL